MTRRKIRKVHEEAQGWYTAGIWWERARVGAPYPGPMRIAFEAGRNAGEHGIGNMPGEVWALVLADWLRGG